MAKVMNKVNLVQGQRQRSGREQGQGIVEFALIAPILFLLILGIIEFGFAFNAYSQVVYAARTGARAGAIYVYSDSLGSMGANDAQRAVASSASVTSSLGRLRAGSATITASYDPSDGTSWTRTGDRIVVDVSYPYDFLSPVFAVFSGVTMSGRGTAQIE